MNSGDTELRIDPPRFMALVSLMAGAAVLTACSSSDGTTAGGGGSAQGGGGSAQGGGGSAQGGTGGAGQGGTGAGGSGGTATGGSAGTGGTAGTGGGGGATCSAANCPGCCFNGQCQPGNTQVACGAAGQACLSCAAFEHCPANQCAINPESLWDVVAVSASCETTTGGQSWDTGGGAPDLRMCFESPPGTVSKCTKEVSDQFNATWNETIAQSQKASLLMSQGFAVTLYDVDGVANDYAGGLQKFAGAHLKQGTVTADGGKACDLTVKFLPK